MLECPKGVVDDVAAQAVDKIVKNPEIEPHPTEWSEERAERERSQEYLSRIRESMDT